MRGYIILQYRPHRNKGRVNYDTECISGKTAVTVTIIRLELYSVTRLTTRGWWWVTSVTAQLSNISD